MFNIVFLNIESVTFWIHPDQLGKSRKKHALDHTPCWV
jgi:hypothetical protein